jgi:hypothetical protein
MMALARSSDIRARDVVTKILPPSLIFDHGSLRPGLARVVIASDDLGTKGFRHHVDLWFCLGIMRWS